MNDNEQVTFLEREVAKVHFIESYGSNNVSEYCFLDEDNKPLHPQVRCKDYIQDLFWTSKLIQSTSDENELQKLRTNQVCGFKPFLYCETYPFIDRDLYRVGIRFRTEGQNFRQYDNMHVELAQQLISRIETGFEFPISKVSLSNSGEILIFEFSSRWTTTPYLLSLYLLLIRVLNKASIEEMKAIDSFEDYLLTYPSKNSGNDASNLAGALYLLEKLFKQREFPQQKWEDYKTINDIHNNSGVSSFSKFLKKAEELKATGEKSIPLAQMTEDDYDELEEEYDEDDEDWDDEEDDDYQTTQQHEGAGYISGPDLDG